jgi:hypothetical protein
MTSRELARLLLPVAGAVITAVALGGVAAPHLFTYGGTLGVLAVPFVLIGMAVGVFAFVRMFCKEIRSIKGIEG